MALLTAAALILSAVSVLLLASAVNTILHVTAVGGAILAAGFLLRYLEEENPLDFSDEIFGLLSYIAVSAGAGFLLYRVFEALITASGAAISLVSIIAVVLFFVNPSLLVTLLDLVIQGVLGLLDEQ